MSSMEKSYIQFTKEMKKDYTILVPNMLTVHLELVIKVLENEGYKLDLLKTQGDHIAETGLKYVHNDTCYPAILVIGQFIDAIQSGKYDPHKVALIMFQTGGGCRASNYISLIRKALEKAGYGYVPVISFSLAGLETHPGFKLTLPLLKKMIYAVIYGDMLLTLKNQCKPYELVKGDTDKLVAFYSKQIAREMNTEGITYKKMKTKFVEILKSFSAIPMEKTPKVKVGIVGEIYVKFSPLGNNNLEQFLIDNDAEVRVPGLFDFLMYCIYNNINDYRLYKRGRFKYPFIKLAYNFMLKKQKEVIEIIKANGDFTPFTPFDHTASLVEDYIGVGCKMGEGWLLPAEMLELADSGVKNIVCTQPFGCLPNHICGKGMMKPLKDRNPDINIVAIDYDASATRVNQENRIKLMLSNAKQNLEAELAREEKATETKSEKVTV